MLTSSTLTFAWGSGEGERCWNMAPVRRLRSFAWMKARRLPGVRCSTLNTECKSLLCLMIMPGRSWVAGIDIAGLHLLTLCQEFWTAGQVAKASAAHRSNSDQTIILHSAEQFWELGRCSMDWHLLERRIRLRLSAWNLWV